MFSPSSRFENGSLHEAERNNTIFKRNDDRTPIFFKDIDEKKIESNEMDAEAFDNTIFLRRANPFVERNSFVYNPLSQSEQELSPFEKHSNMSNSGVGNTTGSSTYVASFDYTKKKEIPEIFKVSNPGTSVSSQRVGIIRRQLLLQSHFKSFKILSVLTFLMFFCPLVSVLLGISCVSNDSICLPRFQIQTSGIVDTKDDGFFSWFDWKTINENIVSQETELKIIEKFIDGLSSMLLPLPYDSNLITAKIEDIFQNEKSVIFKLSDFGYCKEVIDDYNLRTEKICHLFFPHGLDIPSVFVKDLTYMLSKADIHEDAEYISNIFSKSCRDVFNFLDFSDFKDKDLSFYGFLSSVLSHINTYLTIVEYILDVTSLVILIAVSVTFKIKAKKSLTLFKDNLFDSNFRKQYTEQSHKFLWIQICLLLVIVLLSISTILKLIGVFYILVYGLKTVSLLTELESGLINGIKIVSSGMIFDIFNIIIHFITGLVLTLCVIYKPWIVEHVIE